jgi:hypothetical protein
MHSNLYLTQLQIQAQQQRIGDLVPAARRTEPRRRWRSVAARVLPSRGRPAARPAGAPGLSALPGATPANRLAC